VISIKKARGIDPERYLRNELAAYLDHEAAKSRWLGRGSEIRGLDGPVSNEDFAKGLLGYDPSDHKTAICRNPGPDRVSAYGVVFSPHKSVTLVDEFGSEEERRAISFALDRATERIVQAFEDVSEVRRGAGGKWREKPAGLFVAEHEHKVARRTKDALPDPQTHRHMTFLTAALCQDGKGRTIDGDPYFGATKSFDALGQQELAFQLRRFGFQVELELKGKKQAVRIVGISDDQVKTFSKRSRRSTERSVIVPIQPRRRSETSKPWRLGSRRKRST
jgi:conjugative relaxase-like TrwC/TraI family protein